MKAKKCESEKTKTPTYYRKASTRKDPLVTHKRTAVTWTTALSALRVNARRSPSPGKVLLGAEGEIDIGGNAGLRVLPPRALAEERLSNACFRQTKTKPYVWNREAMVNRSLKRLGRIVENNKLILLCIL